MDCITCKREMHHLTKDLHTCDSCGLVSSDIGPDPSIYDRSYEIKYNRYENTKTGQYIQRLRYDCVKRHVSGRARLLDFGCGVGSFLKMFIDNNVRCSGFDINPYTEFCDVTALFGKYDIVTFWDSLEHLKKPHVVIRALNPEHLFVCTPSTEDWYVLEKHPIPMETGREYFTMRMADLTEWRHYMPVEHCHYFNENSLKALIKNCGYEILEVNYNESGPRDGGGDKNILTIAAKRTGHGTH